MVVLATIAFLGVALLTKQATSVVSVPVAERRRARVACGGRCPLA